MSSVMDMVVGGKRCHGVPLFHVSVCARYESMIVPLVDERLIYGTGERQRCLAVGNLVVGAVEQIPLGERRPLSANQPLMLSLIQSIFPMPAPFRIIDIPNNCYNVCHLNMRG
jgi:hypothetical protein